MDFMQVHMILQFIYVCCQFHTVNNHSYDQFHDASRHDDATTICKDNLTQLTAKAMIGCMMRVHKKIQLVSRVHKISVQKCC